MCCLSYLKLTVLQLSLQLLNLILYAYEPTSRRLDVHQLHGTVGLESFFDSPFIFHVTHVHSIVDFLSYFLVFRVHHQ